MKKALPAAALALAIWGSFGAPPRFEKVSPHCYTLKSQEGENIGAVVTEEGVLLVNPPHDPSFSLEALKQTTSKAVRWVVFTDHSFSRAAGARRLAEQGAVMLASAKLRALANAAANAESKDVAAPTPEANDGKHGETPSFPWFLFDSQMRLYPSNLEIRIFALQHKARTGGDVVVHVPAEKVLFVGNLYEAARFPDIDSDSGGSALGWMAGLKQIVDSVPLLKPAIPQAKVEPKPDQAKTLEEGIVVLSAQGGVSNLKNMKDLLEASQRLRKDIARAIRAGHTCESYLASPASDPFRSFGNLEPFAAQLFEALTSAAARDKSTD
jgi:hypothetical protein